MLRTFVGFLAVLALASTLLSQTTPSQPAVQPDNPHRLRPPTDQELHLAYWILEPGWHTEIDIRNNTSEKTISVTPVLRTAAGSEVPLATVSLSPDAVTRIDLTQAVAAAAPELLGRSDSYGSVALRYSAWAAKNIYAAVMLHRRDQPISFHFDAADPKRRDSGGSWESIWWLPTDSTESLLLLSNAASQPTVALTTLTTPTGAPHSFATSLGPYQTARIDLRAATAKAGFAENYGSLQVRFDSRAGHAVQLSYDDQVGFSKLMKVFYRGPQAQTRERITTRAPMVALTRPDPVLLFPPDTRLQSRVLIRNASAGELPVTVSINWKSADTWGAASIPFPALKAAETRILDLSALQEQGVIPSTAAWATVNLSYSGQRGDLIAVAASHAGGRYMVQSPFSESVTFQWKGGEWLASTLHNSLITAGNGGATPAKVAFYLYTNDGKTRYEFPPRTLAPGEQMWVDVGQVLRSQAPDKSGKVLPIETQSGSYEIVDLDPPDDEPGRLYEGKLVIDKTRGHVTYGCAWPCCTADAWIELNPLSGGSGFQFQETGYKNNDCDPTPVITNFVNWFSFNTSVATVSGGFVNGIGIGSTFVSAGNNFFVNTGESCTKEYLTDQTQVEVQCPVPTNFRRVSWFPSSDGKVTITYAWDSNTGSLFHLSGCVISEIVNYPTANSTYIWPPPMAQSTDNPTVVTGPASGGGFQDEHRLPNSFVPPYSQASFTASQVYRYTCPCANGGNPVDLASFTITRSVTQNADSTWKYTVTKSSGESATRSPLP